MRSQQEMRHQAVTCRPAGGTPKSKFRRPALDHPGTALFSQVDFTYDFALLKLDEPIGSEFGTLGYQRSCLNSKWAVTSAGYPGVAHLTPASCVFNVSLLHPAALTTGIA